MHVEWQITHRKREEDKKKRKTSPYVNDKDFRIFFGVGDEGRDN